MWRQHGADDCGHGGACRGHQAVRRRVDQQAVVLQKINPQNRKFNCSLKKRPFEFFVIK